MKALITGASSGIGRDMARVLAKAKVDLILVARRKERLMELKKELPVHVTVVVLDVSKRENCEALYQRFVHEPIDILINNAGFGDYGEFHETELDKDLQMVQTNIQAVHILTKLFLKDFIRRDKGYERGQIYAIPYWRFGFNEEGYHAERHHVMDNEDVS